MSNGEQHDQILTWGMGSPERTLTGLTSAEAADAERDLCAWGPVRVTLDPDGTPCWASSHRPLPEGNTTRQYIQDLKDQQARIDWNRGGARDRYHDPGRQIGGALQGEAGFEAGS